MGLPGLGLHGLSLAGPGTEELESAPRLPWSSAAPGDPEAVAQCRSRHSDAAAASQRPQLWSTPGILVCSGSFSRRNGTDIMGWRRGKWCQPPGFSIQAQFPSCYPSSCEVLTANGKPKSLNKQNKQNPRLGHCHLQDTAC